MRLLRGFDKWRETRFAKKAKNAKTLKTYFVVILSLRKKGFRSLCICVAPEKRGEVEEESEVEEEEGLVVAAVE